MGLKRITPNWWLRMKSGRGVGFAVFMVMITLVGTAIGILSATGKTISVCFGILLGVFCVVVGLGVAYIRGRLKLLPDSFVDDMSSDGPYSCAFCSAEKLREACEMTKPFYGHEYVSPDVAEQWRMKNPKAFAQITNSGGELCACFGILALKDSFFDQFTKGRVSDKQLSEDSICSFDDSKKSCRFYISGVVVRDSSTYVGRKRACVMMWAMLKYLQKLYGVRRKRVLYAIAVTKEAEQLMKNLRFELQSPAKSRVDKCNMYKYQLSKESWVELMRRVGDFSPMCECKF